MKKILVFIFLGFILSGCATYKFQKPASSSAQGYLACYDNNPILEYTVGKEKSLPDLILAKERFKRRRSTVEYYYKKMHQIEPRLKYFFWDPPVMLVDFLGGVLRWPFVAVADYKYNRNPKYKERVDRLDEEKEELEKARVNALKEKLAAYIVEDLNKEELHSQGVVAAAPIVAKPKLAQESLQPVSALPVTQEVVSKKPAPQKITPQASVAEPPKETKPAVMEPMVVKTVLEPPVAVIVAKPMKGYSPLIVKFSGQKSYSKSGKIIAYDWNFGDGDTSTKKNPENTYWSTTFGSRNFTVTLTVKDDAGNASSASTIIEVITK
ncbi:MAG: PKD domain-containing protein [Candidatus Omnitrophica bacterium]|nr:PKD domain-containing protein [Candidatus Omnitrophota bacterium]